MRRFTLGLLILGGGLLLSLPFRRAQLDPAGLDGRVQSTKPHPLDDRDIRLLVREVTQDVEVPTVYDPHTDYLPPQQPEPTRHLPLTYEDLAVPVDPDPFYQNRFNAALHVAQQNADANQSRRLAALEKVFEQTQYVDQSIAGMRAGTPPPRAIPVDGKQWLYQQDSISPDSVSHKKLPAAESLRPAAELQLASSDAGGNLAGNNARAQNSILAPLPAPDQPDQANELSSQRQWIQQPD